MNIRIEYQPNTNTALSLAPPWDEGASENLKHSKIEPVNCTSTLCV